MPRNPVVIIVSALCVLGCIAAITVSVSKWHSHASGGGVGSGEVNTPNLSVDSNEGEIKASNKAVESVCEPTRYKEACVSSLRSSGNTTDPAQLVKQAFRVAKDEITKALEKSKTMEAAKNDPRAAEGLEICKEVIGYAVNDLQRTIDSISSFNADNMDAFLEDMRIWAGGAVTYQEVCFDAFENSTSDAGLKMRQFFNTSRQLTSNALAIITEAKTVLQLLDIPGLDLGPIGARNRRLLSGKGIWVAGVLPAWVHDPKRKVMNMHLNQIKPDAVVAQDGSGHFKTINDALNKVPKKSVTPFIIHIKAGIYKEHVLIHKDLWNVIFVGDGPTKTVITGNKNFYDGVQTFKTATVAAIGEGFMARDIGFENTAGAIKHQAVAIRVVSDLAVFHNCRFDGYQDTLYAVRGRQFYRDCTITGTIDFIFGDAQAVFQRCEMRIRKPLEKQTCMVTAQGRTDPKGPGVFVLQGCTITGEPDYMPYKTKMPAYLGRPWKEYSKTVVMTSNIGDAVAPEGWTLWAGNFALDTLYYGEYQNKGVGSNMAQRVKWAGYKNLSPKEADSFTPAKLFVSGDKWIPQSGVPYVPGTFSA